MKLTFWVLGVIVQSGQITLSINNLETIAWIGSCKFDKKNALEALHNVIHFD